MLNEEPIKISRKVQNTFKEKIIKFKNKKRNELSKIIDERTYIMLSNKQKMIFYF